MINFYSQWEHKFVHAQRFFSTSLRMSDLHYKTKNFIFENSNGFNLIKNILKSDEKSEVKQKKMEDALNQVWNTEITDVLQNKKKIWG